MSRAIKGDMTRAVPAPGVRARSPDLTPLLERVLLLENERNRAHAVSFQGNRVIIRVYERCASDVKTLCVIELPALIRGQLTLTYEEYLALEVVAPIQPHEIDDKTHLAC